MKTTTKLINEDVTLSGDTGDIQIIQNDIALIFPSVDSILIPKKIEYNLRKYVSKSLLKEIDSDIDIAIEKCLVIISNFSSTFFTDDKWKSLSSEILHEQTKIGEDNTYIYKKILTVLKKGTATGAMIEVKIDSAGYEDYTIGLKNKHYRLTEQYLRVGLIEYRLKNKSIIQKRNKDFFKQLDVAYQNTICKNLIKLYPEIDLPANEELLKIGK
ncbi:hypothetical protein G7A72_03250 [Flavobacterium sp. Sr18]|uniref:hypothetical protein n=1 Tax=Flavobacterium sp. Sr18 TaxID=935222 RepID=UPI0013E4BB5B|nr:hypothetical protein [Flavobacterium sp. Sr18]QIH37876.1 hypothetical protein G7A72_03250 [Flavobacterium sp. Sr18]